MHATLLNARQETILRPLRRHVKLECLYLHFVEEGLLTEERICWSWPGEVIYPSSCAQHYYDQHISLSIHQPIRSIGSSFKPALCEEIRIYPVYLHLQPSALLSRPMIVYCSQRNALAVAHCRRPLTARTQDSSH
jgi:hypothetical protein